MVALVLAALGCVSNDPNVRIEGDLRYGECEEELLPWNPRFATYTRTTEDQAVIRFQSGSGPANDHDVFSFQVRDVSLVESELNTPLTVGPPGSDARVIGIAGFPVSCPLEAGVSGVLVGSITFTEFQNKQGTEVEGSFDVQVLDGRDETTVFGEQVTGRFSFEIVLTQPYQIFNLEAAPDTGNSDASVDNLAADAAN